MIDFSNKFGNVGSGELGFFWTNSNFGKSKDTVPSSFLFYGNLGFFQDWKAKPKGIPIGGKEGEYKPLMGVGV